MTALKKVLQLGMSCTSAHPFGEIPHEDPLAILDILG